MRKLVNKRQTQNEYGETVEILEFEENGQFIEEWSTHIDFDKRKGEKYITMEEWEAEEENENCQQSTSEGLSS